MAAHREQAFRTRDLRKYGAELLRWPAVVEQGGSSRAVLLNLLPQQAWASMVLQDAQQPELEQRRPAQKLATPRSRIRGLFRDERLPKLVPRGSETQELKYSRRAN